MLLHRFTDFILRSRVQAMATAFVIAFIPFGGSISILIAALVTLRKGILEGAFVTLAATLPYILSYYASSPEVTQVQFALGMLGIIVISNILTWLFAATLRQFNHWSFTLELAALLGVLVIGMIHLLYPDVQGWWATQLSTYLSKTTQAAGRLGADAVVTGASRDVVQAQVVTVAKQYATGLAVVSVLFNVILQLLIARWWQAVLFNPGGLRRELYQIRLSHITGAAFIVMLVLAYLGNDWTLDAMPVLFGIFLFAGLCLLHNLSSRTKYDWLWLALIYLGIIWLFPLSIVIVSMIALLDTGFDFRKRYKIMKG